MSSSQTPSTPDPASTPSGGPRPSAGAARTPARPAESSGPDRTTADVGLVCSHKGELRTFLKRIDRQRKYTERRLTVRGGFLGESLRVAVIEAGPHYADHRAAAELLIQEHHPRYVFSAGFCSSLDPIVQPGDLCVASEVADVHDHVAVLKCSTSPRKRIHVGRLIVADERPRDAATKATLAARHPGLAVDTTSLAVLQVCQEREVRCHVIRCVIDGVSETIPEKAASMIFEPDSRALGSAMGALFRNWKNLSDLSTWRSRSQTAADHLDRFLAGILEQISLKLGR